MGVFPRDRNLARSLSEVELEVRSGDFHLPPDELLQRASRCGNDAHVELLEHFWLLSFRSPA